MILIDTNVISEMMKISPDSNVAAWLDRQEISQLFISTITIAEISYGLHILSKGSRRDRLEEVFNDAIVELFKHRILSLDETAAYFYGKIMAERKESGRPLSVPDGQILSIAYVHGAAIATRNTRDFVYEGISLLNPFKE
jgi:predicted nucleic acid-binding protein